MMKHVQITTFIDGLHDAPEGHPMFTFRTIYTINEPGFNKQDLTSVVGGRKYHPTAGDKIYLTPGCNVPRFKVKQFCQNNNVALVKYKERANAIFIGPDSIQDKIVTTDYGTYPVPKDHFLKFLDKVVESTDPRYLPLIESIQKSENDIVYVITGVYNTLQNKTHFGIKLYKNNPLDKDESTYHYLPSHIASFEDLKELEAYSNDPRYYNQDDMLKLLNTGGTMTEEMYHSIKRLFESTDVQNTKLAMEAMANCDFEKSSVPLLLLVKEFSSKIQNSGNIHHVNFKSLLKFFNITDVQNITLDTIINSLKAKKLLSPSNLHILMPLAMEQMKKDSHLKHFSVVEVDVTDEVKEALKENILQDPTVEVVLNEPEEEINPHLDIQVT